MFNNNNLNEQNNFQLIILTNLFVLEFTDSIVIVINFNTNRY